MNDEKSNALESRVAPQLKRFAEESVFIGEDIDILARHKGLHLTETSFAIGINTAALYSKKSSHAPLTGSVGILLRLYAAFPHLLQTFEPPEPQALLSRLKRLYPESTNYSLAPLLGLEPNSSYRLLTNGFEGAAQTTRVLAWLINVILDEDESNWDVIKAAVETEAKARNIFPPSTVWKKGGWNRNGKKPQAITSKRPAKGASTASTTLKKPVRRRPIKD